LILILTLFAKQVLSQQNDTLKEFVKQVDIQSSSQAFSVITIQKVPTQPLKGKDLGQLLQEQTPTFVKTYGMGGIATLSIRGGGANHTQVFWNGISVNSPTLGQSDLSLLPVAFSDEIQINPGATASFDGNGGIGGSLILKNNNNHFHKHQSVKIQKEWGSFGIDNTVLDYSIGSKNFFAKTTLLRQVADNNFKYQDYGKQGKPIVKRENAKTSMSGIQQQFGFSKGIHKVMLRANYIHADRQIPVAIGVNPQEQSQLDHSFKSALEWNINQDKKLKIDHQIRAGYIYDKLIFENKTSKIKSAFETETMSLQYHTLWHLKNNLELRTQLITYQFIANSDGFEGVKLQNRTSAYVDVRKQVKDFNFLASLRDEVIDFETHNWIPTLGMDWNFFKNHSFFLNGGINRHQPTLNDLYWVNGGNENLLPEVAVQFEGGFKNDYKYIQYSVSYFQTQVNNWIQWLPSEDGLWRPQNVKNVSKNGLNVLLKFMLFKNQKHHLIAVTNYQYIDVKSLESHLQNDATVGKDLIYSPRHVANFDVMYYRANWSLRYTQHYTSKLFLDAGNTTYLPFSFPAHLELKFNFKEAPYKRNSIDKVANGVEIKLGIQNIFNEIYQTVANQPLPGRHITFGFTFRI
jgi:outer membrane cobalamin receptor